MGGKHYKTMHRIPIKSGKDYAAVTGRVYPPSTVTNVPLGTWVACVAFFVSHYVKEDGKSTHRLFGVDANGKELPCIPGKGVQGDFVGVTAQHIAIPQRDAEGNHTGSYQWEGTCWVAVDEAPQPQQPQAQQTPQQAKAKVVPNT